MYKPQVSIRNAEFKKFTTWLYEATGIALKDSKSKLVEGRLAPRLRHYNLKNYADYFKIISSRDAFHEAQIAVDLLTTNETCFFREPKHFDFLREVLLPGVPAGQKFRAWCAASSTGEEAYSLAMTFAERLAATQWQLLATDINRQVLEKAYSGHYALQRAHNISGPLLKKYCLKGLGKQQGTFLIKKELRDKIIFQQLNLIRPFQKVGKFDVIFLRNVMIYFDNETRVQVVRRVVEQLKTGGYLFVSHSESLIGISNKLKMVSPSVFIKI